MQRLGAQQPGGEDHGGRGDLSLAGNGDVESAVAPPGRGGEVADHRLVTAAGDDVGPHPDVVFHLGPQAGPLRADRYPAELLKFVGQACG
jgi:hypothetical protein